MLFRVLRLSRACLNRLAAMKQQFPLRTGHKTESSYLGIKVAGSVRRLEHILALANLLSFIGKIRLCV